MSIDLLVPERKTLGGAIYDRLRHQIITMVIQPGEMISENTVAADYGVSRTPVRQAFSMLEREELIQILPQRGARVINLSVSKVKEAQFVRESLEGAAFAKVAAQWDETLPRYRQARLAISELLEQQKLAVDAQDYFAFTRLDEDFHSLILGLADNATLLGYVNDVRAHLNRLRYLELKEAHHERPAIEQHIEIFEAIRRNDVVGTQALLSGHLKLLESFREGIFEKYKTLFR